LAIKKQEHLKELLALNHERVLESEEKQEIEALVTEEQALQIRNLEKLEKRLLS